MVINSDFQEVKIPFSGTTLTLNLPRETEINIIQPNENVSVEKFNLDVKAIEFFKDAFWNKITSSRVLIVVNDATRATPTELLLEKLVPFFDESHITCDFIIATGSHRKATEQELKELFGHFYEKYKDGIFNHDAKDESNLFSLGVTSFKSEIKLNKILFDDTKYSAILTINSIEPHYFAGWTGGRKSIVPGLASYETITKTHIHALSKESQNCRLAGNPVHDDLQEGFEMFLEKINHNFYTFQFVLDSNGTIHELFAGDYSVFQKGVAFASKIFQVPIKTVYDLVIAVAYPPLDQDLYQSHKALENSKQAINKSLKPKKSHFILISPCNKGMGPDKFLIPLKRHENLSYEKTMVEISKNYELGFHKAGKILEAEEYTHLHLFTNLDKETAAKAHFVKITDDLSNFITSIILTENISKVLISFDACVTVPVLK